MKLAILTLLFFSYQINSEELDVDRLMSKYGLSPHSLQNINNGQYYNNHHFVSLDSDGLLVSTEDKRAGSLGFEENGIRYFTTNDGEWGAKLEVVNRGNKKLLLEEYVSYIYPKYANRGPLYIVHNSSMNEKGSKLSIIPDRAKPSQPKLITLLPDTPYSLHTDLSGSDKAPLVMLGERSIMELIEDNSLKILLWNAFWEGKLCPTSIVRYKNNYFIGLSHGIAVMPTYGNKKVRFYADKEINDSKL